LCHVSQRLRSMEPLLVERFSTVGEIGDRNRENAKVFQVLDANDHLVLAEQLCENHIRNPPSCSVRNVKSLFPHLERPQQHATSTLDFSISSAINRLGTRPAAIAHAQDVFTLSQPSDVRQHSERRPMSQHRQPHLLPLPPRPVLQRRLPNRPLARPQERHVQEPSPRRQLEV
jgi:hypothetical protein